MSALDEVRTEVLRQLAEQAMSDPAFREVARHDLAGALQHYGYDLNEREMTLVLKFRDALEEVGVDLFLKEHLSEEDLALLRSL
jgi:hypothetical protein